MVWERLQRAVNSKQGYRQRATTVVFETGGGKGQPLAAFFAVESRAEAAIPGRMRGILSRSGTTRWSALGQRMKRIGTVIERILDSPGAERDNLSGDAAKNVTKVILTGTDEWCGCKNAHPKEVEGPAD
jgi:hypothetical protein